MESCSKEEREKDNAVARKKEKKREGHTKEERKETAKEKGKDRDYCMK